MPMTMPISTLHHSQETHPDTVRREMCFWLDERYQDHPPNPSAWNVYIQERPNTQYYVK